MRRSLVRIITTRHWTRLSFSVGESLPTRSLQLWQNPTIYIENRGYNVSSALRVRWNSSNSNNNNNNNNAGEETYQQAVEAMERANEISRQKEQERSRKMFEAWQKSQNAQHDPKTQGVVVVKTLVKQTQKKMTRNSQKNENYDEAKVMQEAMDLLETAAYQCNHPMALVHLGNLALQDASKANGDDDESFVRELIWKAADLFQRAGEAGSRVGWYNLGQLYWTGFPSAGGEEELVMSPDDHGNLGIVNNQQIFSSDLHQAMDAFLKAIDLGDTDAMYLVGVYRMTSTGGRENIHSGLKLIERAANIGHGGAMYYLALLHLNGDPNIGLEPCSEEEFVERLNGAVEAGNVDALFTRGHSYYHGTEGYPQNYKRALEDFLKGADLGHADSAVSAGAMLHTGIGVPKDQRRAFELYQAAGELGSKEGWQNVVACYTTGEGVPQSLETARYIAETMLKDRKS